MFNLLKGSGNKEGGELSINIPAKLADSLNTIKIMYWVLGFIPTTII